MRAKVQFISEKSRFAVSVGDSFFDGDDVAIPVYSYVVQ
jgi:hypothetical protein